jgi:syntaxin 5
VEERRSNFSANHKINKPSKNPFLYTSLPNDDTDSTDNSTHISFEQNQVDNRNQYYQDRSSAVQKIEKTMTDLQGMFTRMAHFVHEQQYMIEKIENNTDISLGNIEAGLKEVIKIQNDVRSNRGLIIKIFLILIVASVIYILFFA